MPSHFIKRGLKDSQFQQSAERTPILQMARFRNDKQEIVTKTVINEKVKPKLWTAAAILTAAAAWGIFNYV